MPPAAPNDPLSAADFKVKFNHLRNLGVDKDKIRMIKVIASQYTLEPKQACELIKQVQSFASIIELCADIQYLTSDEDDFVHDALELCQYPEDRVAMCTMLEVEYIPMQPKEKPKLKPKRISVASGLGGGHAYMS